MAMLTGSPHDVGEVAGISDDLSPEPILAAIENYRGTITDLDLNVTIDAAGLATARRSLAEKLRAGGLRASERIVIAVGNGPLFIAAMDAVLRLGASPLLVHFQLPAAELTRTALKYGARQVLTDADAADLPTAPEGASVTHDLGWRRCAQITLVGRQEALVAPVTPGVGLNGSSLPTAHCSLPTAVPLHPTSGSTGQAKIAVRPGRCAVAEAENYIAATGMDARDAVLVVTPMSHAYSYGMGFMSPLVSGASIVSLRRFAAKPVLEALASGRVTVFPAVPAMLDMLLLGSGGELLARPRFVLSAGAPLARKTVENFTRITGRRISPLYGTTETGGITLGVGGLRPEQFQSVGPTLAGVRASLAPAESAELGEGVGRVMIRSTSMMAGYLSPTGIERSAIDDGWFLTGDVGRINALGEIELLGRESDVINVAGLKVVPSDVEEVLAEYPGVKDCKVYAGTGKTGNQFVKAAIAADESFDEAKFRQYCVQQLAFYKQPVKIARLAALPRNAAGKIIKDQLP
jgi:acyl-CoA synthetase (AMP-forming)/AMP-acid ligase II